MKNNPWLARVGLCAAVCLFVASMAILLLQGTHADQLRLPAMEPAQIQSSPSVGSPSSSSRGSAEVGSSSAVAEQ
jgi:hypothetical protein